ncbi:cytochrome P450 81D11-like [Olea europaea var. sylvestris]|uniref:cytochrome P450 81D11-like n=1 Tax=Olea europaea var. sylvestris TaxID=158386 RepID=UPI000C1D5C19|nr:cytochrome P450 81D11-like [Olea europaea var. sylvestris]
MEWAVSLLLNHPEELKMARLYPVGPHCSSQDCNVQGFEIPGGTTLLVNAWAIHIDPKVWEEPTKFKPGRFDGIEDRTNGFLPFGVGRRACPGSGMAIRLMALALGTFIQCFEWERVGCELVDMEEFCSGRTLSKVKPLGEMYRPQLVVERWSGVVRPLFAPVYAFVLHRI